MGREVRRVPPNWQHPLHKNPMDSRHFQPMFGRCYQEAADEWLQECLMWANGEHPDQLKHPEYKDEYKYYWDYADMPPDKDYFIPYSKEEATWYQVYETVSQGTPVTPAFETKEELIDYLVKNGDYWDQKRGNKPPSREAIEKFVMCDEWCPSGVMFNGVVKTGIESCK